jgi:hypothetical protein
MMHKYRRIYLLRTVILLATCLFFIKSYGSEVKVLAFDKNISKPLIYEPLTYKEKTHIQYTVTDRRANACIKYHGGGSLRQLVSAYQLEYAKHKLTPVNIKYKPFDYGAEIRHPGKLKNSKQRFEIVTSLEVGASKNLNSSIRLNYKHISVCNALLPVDGYIE